MAISQQSPPLSSSIEKLKPLADEINTATRQVHSKLNHLVINRLPLGLPPHATSPQLYLSGLASFAEVYKRFESLWWSIIRPSSSYVYPDQINVIPSKVWHPSHDVAVSLCQSRIHRILNHLYLPDLLRTEGLDKDLSHSPALLDGGHANQPCQSRPQLQAFLLHIEASVLQRPHMLIAYAWVFYMALFSGGRWIRAQLLNAGADFWAEHEASQCPGSGVRAANNHGLSLFYFRSTEDGEDIKREFKSRLLEVENSLTIEERREIVMESQQIFRFCILLVEELDSIHGTSTSPSVRHDRSTGSDAKQADNVMSWRGWHEILIGQKDHIQASWHGLRSAPVFTFTVVRGPAIFALLIGLFLWLTCYARGFPLAS